MICKAENGLQGVQGRLYIRLHCLQFERRTRASAGLQGVKPCASLLAEIPLILNANNTANMLCTLSIDYTANLLYNKDIIKREDKPNENN